jgi:hypothetical protein
VCLSCVVRRLTTRTVNTTSEQRCEELNEATHIAMQYLAAPHRLPKAESLDRWRFVLRLWHYPSFTESRSWGIYQFHEHGSRHTRTLVRQVVWDRPSDAERFTQPLVGLERGFHTQPTIEVRDRPIDTATFDSRLRPLQVVSFPAFATHGLGIDGETFGVAFPEHGSTVEWWCEGPESWRELANWAASTRQWLIDITAAPPQPEIWTRPRPHLP